MLHLTTKKDNPLGGVILQRLMLIYSTTDGDGMDGTPDGDGMLVGVGTLDGVGTDLDGVGMLDGDGMDPDGVGTQDGDGMDPDGDGTQDGVGTDGPDHGDGDLLTTFMGTDIVLLITEAHGMHTRILTEIADHITTQDLMPDQEVLRVITEVDKATLTEEEYRRILEAEQGLQIITITVRAPDLHL